MRFDLTDLRLFLRVVEAGSITHGATEANLEATRVMDEAVYKLFRQTDMLRKEMEAFKI